MSGGQRHLLLCAHLRGFSRQHQRRAVESWQTTAGLPQPVALCEPAGALPVGVLKVFFLIVYSLYSDVYGRDLWKQPLPEVFRLPGQRRMGSCHRFGHRRCAIFDIFIFNSFDSIGLGTPIYPKMLEAAFIGV